MSKLTASLLSARYDQKSQTGTVNYGGRTCAAGILSTKIRSMANVVDFKDQWSYVPLSLYGQSMGPKSNPLEPTSIQGKV